MFQNNLVGGRYMTYERYGAVLDILIILKRFFSDVNLFECVNPVRCSRTRSQSRITTTLKRALNRLGSQEWSKLIG